MNKILETTKFVVENSNYVKINKEKVKVKNPKITSMGIDDHLWLATQKKFPDDKPYHRTRTIDY